MKQAIFLTFFLLFNLHINSQQTKNVLFIGNSITYYNNLPFTFEDIANSKGDPTSVTMYAPGGHGFADHVNDPNVYAKFRERVWDFVVLQPGSGESFGSTQPISATLNRALQLKDSILKYSSCAKILFYEISNGVTGSSANDLSEYNNTMDMVRSNFEYWADNTQLYFAPVGEAFREKWNNDQTDMLWVSTYNIHPNAKGSYLAACVFYASIYQKPSSGTTVTGSLSQAEATVLQQIADEKVLLHKADWRINVYNLYTDFDYNMNGLEVNFTNLSTNADSYFWDFGDGNTSTDTNPIHQYISAGTYQVSLTTTKGNCSETVIKNITPDGISNLLDENSFNLYPDPANNFLRIKTKMSGKYIYRIIDITGKILLTTKRNKIDVTRLKKGLYLMKIIDSFTGKSLIKPWLKK